MRLQEAPTGGAAAPTTLRPPLRWRRWTAVFLLVWLVIAGAGAAGIKGGIVWLETTTRVDSRGFRGAEDQLDAVTRCCRFDLLAWEVRHLSRWVLLRLAETAPNRDHSRSGVDAVRRFVDLGRTISHERSAAVRATSAAEAARAAEAVRRSEEERAALRPAVERAIAAAVETEISQAGLSFGLPGLDGRVFPPLAFAVVRPPSVLVISPRTEIRLERTTVLQPDLDAEVAAGMERAAEAQGWSAIVEPTGGYSTYPTMVTQDAGLDFMLQTVAHEWSHTYLFFQPLGRNYFSSPQMRTINETVANIIGREVAAAVSPRFAPPPAPPTPPPAAAGDAGRPPFDFRAEMRQTRTEAERLLKDGQVDQAEAYMEERRRRFVERGYNIRRLNQAYFAFHGSYADTPGSIDPIGPQLEALFQRSGSLRAFVATIAAVPDHATYLDVLRGHGIDPDATVTPRP